MNRRRQQHKPLAQTQLPDCVDSALDTWALSGTTAAHSCASLLAEAYALGGTSGGCSLKHEGEGVRGQALRTACVCCDALFVAERVWAVRAHASVQTSTPRSESVLAPLLRIVLSTTPPRRRCQPTRPAPKADAKLLLRASCLKRPDGKQKCCVDLPRASVLIKGSFV